MPGEGVLARAQRERKKTEFAARLKQRLIENAIGDGSRLAACKVDDWWESYMEGDHTTLWPTPRMKEPPGVDGPRAPLMFPMGEHLAVDVPVRFLGPQYQMKTAHPHPKTVMLSVQRRGKMRGEDWANHTIRLAATWPSLLSEVRRVEHEIYQAYRRAYKKKLESDLKTCRESASTMQELDDAVREYESLPSPAESDESDESDSCPSPAESEVQGSEENTAPAPAPAPPQAPKKNKAPLIQRLNPKKNKGETATKKIKVELLD